MNLPILIQNLNRGELNIVIDFSEIGNYLALDPESIKRLADRFSEMKPAQPATIPRKRDGLILAKKYAELLGSGAFKTKAELARYLGVSRARVSQVLRRLQR